MWMTFDEIIEKHDLAPFQVVDAFKAGLHPYHIETGEALPYDYDWNTAPTKGAVLNQPWHLVLLMWRSCQGCGNDYLVRAFRSPLVAWRKVDVDDYIKGQEKTPVSTIAVDYSRKTKDEQKEIAKSWKDQGMTRRQIAKRLYFHKLDDVKIESLMTKVDRLFS